MNRKEMLEVLVTKEIDEDEPLFLLRGRDPLAAVSVLRWVSEAKEAGVVSKKVKQAETVAFNMLAWPEKKLPD